MRDLVASATRCPSDDEGRSASAVASRTECGCSTPHWVTAIWWPLRCKFGSAGVGAASRSAACSSREAGQHRAPRAGSNRTLDQAPTCALVTPEPGSLADCRVGYTELEDQMFEMASIHEPAATSSAQTADHFDSDSSPGVAAGAATRQKWLTAGVKGGRKVIHPRRLKVSHPVWLTQVHRVRLGWSVDPPAQLALARRAPPYRCQSSRPRTSQRWWQVGFTGYWLPLLQRAVPSRSCSNRASARWEEVFAGLCRVCPATVPVEQRRATAVGPRSRACGQASPEIPGA